MLEAASGFLATRAIAGGGQNRPADCLQSHFAAPAYPGEMFLLFLVHCNRPFVDPVCEVILAFVRNVRNGSVTRRNTRCAQMFPHRLRCRTSLKRVSVSFGANFSLESPFRLLGLSYMRDLPPDVPILAGRIGGVDGGGG